MQLQNGSSPDNASSPATISKRVPELESLGRAVFLCMWPSKCLLVLTISILSGTSSTDIELAVVMCVTPKCAKFFHDGN